MTENYNQYEKNRLFNNGKKSIIISALGALGVFMLGFQGYPGFKQMITDLSNKKDIEIEVIETDQVKIQRIFSLMSNSETSSQNRLDLIVGMLTYFSTDAEILQFGSNGMHMKPIPVEEYFNRIALYKSLERIEVLKISKNEEDKYREIQIKEHHFNMKHFN